MTEPIEIHTFGKQWHSRIKETVRWKERQERKPNGQRRRDPLAPKSKGTTSFSSNGASCGCCDPSNCADYLQPLSNDTDCPEGPFGWEVNFGNSITLSQLCQNLTKDSEGNFELEYVGYGVWRSESFTCNGEATAGGCNSGSGSCTDVYEEFAYDAGESAYVRLPDSPVCPDGCNASTPTGNSDMELGTVLRPCYGENHGIYVSNDGSNWVRTGGSECEPIDISGIPPTAIGDIMNVPCAGDEGGAPSGTQYAWIQLTTDNTRDADGRSNTKLELIVGGVAAFTFRPRIGFDWCCSCENKMELQCCGPFAFQFIPESVCVKPMGPGDLDDRLVEVGDGAICCDTIDVEDKQYAPRYAIVNISASRFCETACCDGLSGSFILEWDNFALGGFPDGAAAWVYSFHGFENGSTCQEFLDAACRFPGDDACAAADITGSYMALSSLILVCTYTALGDSRFKLFARYLVLDDACGECESCYSTVELSDQRSDPEIATGNCFERTHVLSSAGTSFVCNLGSPTVNFLL